MNPPPFKGGQGRCPESVLEAGTFLMGLAVVAAIMAAIVWIARWCA